MPAYTKIACSSFKLSGNIACCVNGLAGKEQNPEVSDTTKALVILQLPAT